MWNDTMDIPNIYASPNYRFLIILPIALVLLSLAMVFFVSPVRFGIDFKGGIDVTIQTASEVDVSALKSALAQGGFEVVSISSKPNPAGFVTQIELERSAVLVRAANLKSEFYSLLDIAANDEAEFYSSNSSEAKEAYLSSRRALDEKADEIFALAKETMKASSFNTTSQLQRAVSAALSALSTSEQDRLAKIVSSASPPDAQASFEEVTASLSSKFLETAVMVAVFAIVLTTIIVFVIFRSTIPSLAVIAGALSDVIFALGAMSIFGIPLTLASFSALLMLVGFSLDTDVLLSMRVIKQKEGTAASRAYSAMKTGMTMSLSAIVAFSCLFILSLITHIPIYYEISSVVLAGLVGDLIATWCFNAVIILHFVEEQQKKGLQIDDKPLLSYFFKN
jgi:preprotein translocase subunit SecF